MVDLETIEALYENVRITAHFNNNTIKAQAQVYNNEPFIYILLCQRAQPEELERIKKHYETSEEEEVKLLDKPEQSVSHLLTQMFRDYASNRLSVCVCGGCMCVCVHCGDKYQAYTW